MDREVAGEEKFLHPQSVEADLPCLLTRNSTGSWEPGGTSPARCEETLWTDVCMCECPSRSNAGPGCGGLVGGGGYALLSYSRAQVALALPCSTRGCPVSQHPADGERTQRSYLGHGT